MPTVRDRTVDAAARLLHEHGAEAVTTRRVAEAAGTQAPTIYRLFGDKDGLLDAVAEHVLGTYVGAKSGAAAAEDGDPVDDLRAGWDRHVAFGLANPAVFALLTDPLRRGASPAGQAGMEVLRARLGRVAAAGRLKVSEDHALRLVHAAGTGAVLTLLAFPLQQRDLSLADAMYDAVAAAILADSAAPVADDAVTAAVTFRTVAGDLPHLSAAERRLLREWLDRAVT